MKTDFLEINTFAQRLYNLFWKVNNILEVSNTEIGMILLRYSLARKSSGWACVFMQRATLADLLPVKRDDVAVSVALTAAPVY